MSMSVMLGMIVGGVVVLILCIIGIAVYVFFFRKVDEGTYGIAPRYESCECKDNCILDFKTESMLPYASLSYNSRGDVARCEYRPGGVIGTDINRRKEKLNPIKANEVVVLKSKNPKDSVYQTTILRGVHRWYRKTFGDVNLVEIQDLKKKISKQDAVIRDQNETIELLRGQPSSVIKKRQDWEQMLYGKPMRVIKERPVLPINLGSKKEEEKPKE